MQAIVAQKLLAHAINAEQIVSIAQANLRLGVRRTLFIQGENGIGKTAVLNALQALPEFKDHIFSYIDCANLSLGDFTMPAIDKESMTTHYAPNARFGVTKQNHRAVKGAKPVVLFLDEFTKAGKAVSNMLAPTIYEYRIGDLYLPEGSLVFGTGNLEGENLGDQMEAHKATRLIKVTMKKPSSEEWMRNFAMPRDINHVVRAWVRETPQLLDQSFLNFVADGIDIRDRQKGNPFIYDARDPGCKAYVSPRTLEFAADIVTASDQYPPATRDYVMSAQLVGTIGEAAMQSLRAFVHLDRDIPSIQQVMADPLGTPVPKQRMAHMLMTDKLLSATNDRKAASAACKYITRLGIEFQALFAREVTAQSNKTLHFSTVPEFHKILQDNRTVI